MLHPYNCVSCCKQEVTFKCTAAGVGRVKQRDNAALWGTDAEPKLRQPDDSFWKKYAAECSRVQIAVDVFIFWCGPAQRPKSPCQQAKQARARAQALLRTQHFEHSGVRVEAVCMGLYLPEPWHAHRRSPSFIDVASFGALSRYTCGQLYYYPGFHPDRDGARVEAEARPMRDSVLKRLSYITHLERAMCACCELACIL